MTAPQKRHAADVVRRAIAGEAGELGRDLAAILQAGAEQGRREQQRAERDRIKINSLEREAWALSFVLGGIMDGDRPDDVVDDLPHDVRRRVIACRHVESMFGSARPSDQFGPLPTPPSRSSVMRDRVRVVDVDPL